MLQLRICGQGTISLKKRTKNQRKKINKNLKSNDFFLIENKYEEEKERDSWKMEHRIKMYKRQGEEGRHK